MYTDLYSTLLPSDAVVGLDKTDYQVSEDVGVVEVCAIVHTPNITCPIEFTFHINLSTSDKSAGIYTSTMCRNEESISYSVL